MDKQGLQTVFTCKDCLFSNRQPGALFIPAEVHDVIAERKLILRCGLRRKSQFVICMKYNIVLEW